MYQKLHKKNNYFPRNSGRARIRAEGSVLLSLHSRPSLVSAWLRPPTYSSLHCPGPASSNPPISHHIHIFPSKSEGRSEWKMKRAMIKEIPWLLPLGEFCWDLACFLILLTLKLQCVRLSPTQLVGGRNHNNITRGLVVGWGCQWEEVGVSGYHSCKQRERMRFGQQFLFVDISVIGCEFIANIMKITISFVYGYFQVILR